MVDRRFEPEDIFDRQEAAERRARIDAAKAEHEVFERHEAEEKMHREARCEDLTRRSNEISRLRAYAAAGVTPPVIDGVPTKSSLALLRQLGWTVESGPLGTRMLLRPPPAEPWTGKRREDYDQSS